MMIVTNNRREKKEKNTADWRLKALMVFPFIAFVVVTLKLCDIQVFKGSYYEALAEGQSKIFQDLIPNRGEILVKDKYSEVSYPLAANHKLYMVYASPKHVKEPAKAALALASILEVEEKELLEKLDKKDDPYEPLKKELSEEKKQEVEKLELEGIYFQEENYRYYPENSLAAHVIGFVGFADNERRGVYGVEGYYEEELAGKKGYLESDRDALGRFISVGQKFVDEAEDGQDIVLTIDRTIQFKVEKLLKEGVEKFGAENGTVIIMEPYSGAIIAMANYPNYNPNEYAKQEDVNIFSNAAIYDLYEPGSAFKPIIMAGALNDGLVGATTTIEDGGSIKVGEYTIYNSDRQGSGTITMTQVLEKSSNVGMVQVAQMMGTDRVYDYIERFGFSGLTGIDLLSEASASITDKELWSESDLATASFGQGTVTITPLQLVTAYAAIANGGNLVQPHVVEKFINNNGQEKYVETKQIRQVISPSTAATLSAMMVSVVSNGFGGSVKIPGYKIAGKTGTAQVPREDGPGYDSGKKITSFAGFGPIDDPKFVMLVKFDNPGGEVWGVTTAAPIFKEITLEMMKYYQIAPTEETN